MALRGFLGALAFAKTIDTFIKSIEAVLEEDLWVGTAAPFAGFVEAGTGPHRNATGRTGFITRLMQWGQREGLSRSDVFAVAEHIRQEGTEPQPFYRPAVNKMARDHDFVVLDRETPGRIDLVVDPIKFAEEDDMSLRDVANDLQETMREEVPKSRGEDGGLAASIVVATSKSELIKKSQAALES